MIERILQLMELNGMTAKELTALLGLNRSAISEWKSGKAKPTVQHIINISKIFNVSTDYLLTGESDKKATPIIRTTFYEKFEVLCKGSNTTPTAVLKELGISTSKITAWKNGSVPNLEFAARIANRFNVPLDYFVKENDDGLSIQDKPVAYDVDGNVVNITDEALELARLRANQALTKRIEEISVDVYHKLETDRKSD